MNTLTEMSRGTLDRSVGLDSVECSSRRKGDRLGSAFSSDDGRLTRLARHSPHLSPLLNETGSRMQGCGTDGPTPDLQGSAQRFPHKQSDVPAPSLGPRRYPSETRRIHEPAFRSTSNNLHPTCVRPLTKIDPAMASEQVRTLCYDHSSSTSLVGGQAGGVSAPLGSFIYSTCVVEALS